MEKRERQLLAHLRRAAREAMAEQIAFAQIPCPSWKAASRGEHLAGKLAEEGLRPRRDKVGNLIAVRKGSHRSKRPTLILSAHMDSVFYDVKEIKVERRGRRYHAPGICDNAVGVAALIMLARAFARFEVETAGDIVFVGSVGEEGEGRLRGMRYFWKDCPHENPWFISIDGPGASVTRKALASWSPKIVVRGPGGHSYSDFGRPNPVHMLARYVTKITETLEADADTNTVFNATVISGGTAVNVIPAEARLTLNLRSSDVDRLDRMVKTAKKLLREAKAAELEWATSDGTLEVRCTAYTRPGGQTPENHPLVEAAMRAYTGEGLKPASTVGSTDANMPMSLGVPAINITAGGASGNAHSTDEWYENTGRGAALSAIARMVLETSG